MPKNENLTFKKKPRVDPDIHRKIVAATGKPDYSTIENMFETAVSKVGEFEKRAAPTTAEERYWMGVKQALGWVIGQFSEDPLESWE